MSLNNELDINDYNISNIGPLNIEYESGTSFEPNEHPDMQKVASTSSQIESVNEEKRNDSLKNMTTLNEWIDLKIKDGDINYFEYSEFSNVEKVGRETFVEAFGTVSRADWNCGGIKVALKTILQSMKII
jgi:hypothetical protein